MSRLELLKGARERLTPPHLWVQGYGGNREQGTFCLFTAFVRARNSEDNELLSKLIGEIENSLPEIGGSRSMIRWNDLPGRTHAEVLAVLDQAIEKEEAASDDE